MRWRGPNLLLILLASGTALGQPQLSRQAERVEFIQLAAVALRGNLKAWTPRGLTARECQASQTLTADYKADLDGLIAELQKAPFPGGEEGQPQYDVHRSAYALGDALGNIGSAVRNACGPASGAATEFALLYVDLARANINISELFIDGAKAGLRKDQLK